MFQRLIVEIVGQVCQHDINDVVIRNRRIETAGNVRGDGNVLAGPERVVFRQRFMFKDVQEDAGEVMHFCQINQSCFINGGTSADIDENGTGFCLCQSFSCHDMGCFSSARQSHGNDIISRQNIIQLIHRVLMAVEGRFFFPGSADAVYYSAQGMHTLSVGGSDIAHADGKNGKGGDGFHRAEAAPVSFLLHRGIFIQLLDRCHGTCQHIFRDGFAIGAGSVCQSDRCRQIQIGICPG